MLNHNDEGKNFGRTINFFIAAVGFIGILLGIIWQDQCVLGTIFLSVGTSVFATALVTEISAGYLLKSQRLEKLVSSWRLHGLYTTKADMNTIDANQALRQCKGSIDIIGEGLSSYIAAQGDTLRSKILNENVKVRIISCDSDAMLRQRAQDEGRGWDEGGTAVQKVKALDQWVSKIREELGENADHLQIRFHSSYPGLSYLRIDGILFVSTNLWRKPSQLSLAMSFSESGTGYCYFKDYFEDIWQNFASDRTCRLSAPKRQTGKSPENRCSNSKNPH